MPFILATASHGPQNCGSAYVYHQDPGHGWLAVPRSELARLNIEDKVSSYSYQSRDRATVYLEEDCDMSAFVKAKEAIGETVYYRDHYIEQTPIRNMRPFSA